MSVVLRKHWTAVERGFAERYGILDLASTFNGRPLGYRKFEALAAPFIVDFMERDDAVHQSDAVPQSVAAAAPDTGGSDLGDWRSKLPLPLPKPDSRVTLDQFVAAGG